MAGRRRPLALEKLRSLGTPAGERFDRIVRLARRICDAPVASVELGAAASRRSPGLPFQRDVDLRVDGRRIGVLRVGDYVPRTLDASQEEMLRELASLAADQIDAGAAQRELATENEQLKTWAFVDSLTSVWNRHAIVEIAEREMQAARTGDHPVAVAIVDVDFFKHVNDRHGHAVGDAVLREIASRLRGAMRATDAVGRYGGEEFLVVMPECSIADSIAAGERIRQAIAAPMQVEGLELTVTASVGVAVRAADGGGLDDVIRAADVALYQAKAEGRDRVVAAAAREHSDAAC